MTASDSVLVDSARRSDVERVGNLRLSTVHGDFLAFGYQDHNRGDEQIALVYGDVKGEDALTRVHSECLTGDAFGSRHCECGDQLSAALRAIVSEGRGAPPGTRGGALWSTSAATRAGASSCWPSSRRCSSSRRAP